VMAVLKHRGPTELLVEFLNMMPPSGEKFDTAMVCRQYHIAIDVCLFFCPPSTSSSRDILTLNPPTHQTLVAMGDRGELMRLKKVLKMDLGPVGYHEYKNKIDELLENKKIKWKGE